MSKQTHILFVCLGNIVRSPLAEHMFQHLANEAGVGDRFSVDSAGTSAFHVGESPDSRMRRVAASNGLKYDGASRQVENDDFERFDMIIAMDGDNRRNLLLMAQKQNYEHKVHLMRAFDSQAIPTDPVPDPWYGGMDGFEKVYKIIERSCQGLLDALQSGELEV
ncbi:MAG: low molecular weight phosphotyrosine protein phosphatase [Chloroflexi bacterium]|nr:low molecular weight phosphotyrosine protein phosphatase [Chloroflexota bacterium]